MKVVIFDLYETLVTFFDPDWTPPSRTDAQRLGIEEHTYKNLWPQFDRAWQTGEIKTYGAALGKLCVAAAVNPDRVAIEKLSDELHVTIDRIFNPIDQEIVSMISALKQSGLKLGVVTNAGDVNTKPWPESPLAPLFDEFVASHEVGMLKPDQRIFKMACDRLSVQPSEAVFVGDGGSNELLGASQVGLTARWASWFIDKWPQSVRPGRFPGDEWRQGLTDETPYGRLRAPEDLLTTMLR